MTFELVVGKRSSSLSSSSLATKEKLIQNEIWSKVEINRMKYENKIAKCGREIKYRRS